MLKIITIPNKSLRERSQEVGAEFFVSPEAKKLIKEMIKTMYQEDGVGLAAPQVGYNIRVSVISKNVAPDKKYDLVLINPQWIKTSRKTAVDFEGCLSVPKTFGKVKRYKDIKVTAWDENGRKHTFSACDMLARVIQHEVDHLDGILFIDKAKDIYQTE